ncbi:zinc transporter ZntB [Utexia brackfieldae]|uniref:zinc transporter ZntB n=1 Tax=Utexia brackfieldae TaxID=3074108 RepID=UPI00370DC36B
MITEHDPQLLTGQQFLDAKPVFCCQLTGKGDKTALQPDSQASNAKPFWIHLDYQDKQTVEWIKNTQLLPDIAKTSLISKNQTAKSIRFDTHRGMLVVLKGVNITPGDQYDPIVTLRFYITDNFILSTRHQKINAINDLQLQLDKKIGPVDVADWLVQISENLTNHANQAVENIHDQVIKLEDYVLTQQRVMPHQEIGRVRRKLITLRRILTPQRDTFIKIATERLSWIDDNDRRHMHDIATRLNHYIGDIDTCLLRLSSILEQINAMFTEQMNKRIYIMSILATIFMPLTFLASLFGVNLAGIPFTTHLWSFGVFSAILTVLGIMLSIWLKRKQWL